MSRVIRIYGRELILVSNTVARLNVSAERGPYYIDLWYDELVKELDVIPDLDDFAAKMQKLGCAFSVVLNARPRTFAFANSNSKVSLSIDYARKQFVMYRMSANSNNGIKPLVGMETCVHRGFQVRLADYTSGWPNIKHF